MRDLGVFMCGFAEFKIRVFVVARATLGRSIQCMLATFRARDFVGTPAAFWRLGEVLRSLGLGRLCLRERLWGV